MPPVLDEELHRVGRRERPQDGGVLDDLAEAADAPGRANQTPMTGPNSRPTAPVPKRWIANRPVRIASVIGTTSESSDGRRHLQALDRGEHRDGGRDHAVAVEQRGAEDAERDQRHRGPRGWRDRAPWTSAIRAMMPPSPSLSARMMNVTYLIDTMIVTAQNTSEMHAVDRRLRVGTAPCSASKTVCSA